MMGQVGVLCVLEEGRISPPPPCALSLDLFALAFGSLFDVVSWVQPLQLKDVLVAWRRRMRRCWVSRVWEMIHMAIW